MAEPTPAPGDTGKPWYDGKITDAVEIGHLQNRGWDKLDAAGAAAAAVKAHREAEKHLGLPADQLLRMPKDGSDVAALDAIYQRLGAPKEAKGYDDTLNGIKFEDGSTLDDGLKNTIRTIAHRNHLTPAQTADLAKEIVKLADTDETGDKADAQAKYEIEAADLRRNWGANMEVNTAIARSAAQKVGISADALATIEKASGYKAVMEAFLKIGQAMGEDQFIRDPNNPGGGTVLSREQAIAKLDELKSDKAFVAKYLAGDERAAAEMMKLTTIVASNMVYR
jgi:hypothetical protein